jgi:GTP-binding protein
MKIPIVTIVGRPNVGKSTFFNRLLKRRDAIVDDQPGVTRDRHYAESDWNGKQFMLVDTGGYMPDSKDEINVAVREQVDIAIEESDVILFIVDVITGITDIDMQLAEKLKRTNKPVILVVNKADTDARALEAYEFYQLGLGDPAIISCMQSRGVGDLLDRLVNAFDTTVDFEKEVSDEIKVAVIGRENAGKSSFVNTLLGTQRTIVTPIPGTTRDPIDSLLKYQKRNYLLIDTAGLKRRAKVKENVLFYSQLRTMRSLQRAQVVIYFIDASEYLTRQDMRVIAEAARSKKGIVIAINKWDLIEKDDKTMLAWQRDLVEKLGEFSYIPIVFTSVLQKQRLYKLMDTVTEVYEELQKKISTSELNKVLLPIIHENSPPAVKGKEIKINYITQLKTAAPVFGFFGNHPDLIPDNYRRFLERQIREHWQFRGVPITLAFKSKHKERRTG